MALLAYDPERVSRLRQRLIEASADLRRVTCADPAATDATRVIRVVLTQLDATWLPLVTRLLESDPLAGSQLGGDRIASLDQSLIRVMAHGYGWAVQHDPRSDDTSVVTAQEARALGAMLNSVGPVSLANDPEQLAWLSQQLDVIGGDPALSVQFLANFHDWDVLPYVLAQQRTISYDRDYAGITFAVDLDPVFAGLMSIWRNTLPVATLNARADASLADPLPPMNAADPYVQALMLHALRLDPIALATIANDLLREWLDTKVNFGSGTLDLGVAYGPNTADLLLQDIACSSAASGYFLSLIADRPELLFQTLDDPAIGYQIALSGTDPASSSSATSGRIVLTILDYFETDPYASALSTDGYPGDYGQFLSKLVAPWLLQFTGANEEWDADNATRVRLLGVALNDEQSLHALVAASQRIASGFGHSLITARNDDQTLTLSLQIGGLLSLLGQLVINEHIDDRNEQSNFLWNLTWTVLNAATNFVPGGAAANIAASSGASELERALAPHFLGPTADEVRHDDEYAMDVVLTVTASVMMTAMFQSWQEAGRLAPGATPPPLPIGGDGCPSGQFRTEMERWARQLPGGPTGTLSLTALTLMNNFISRPQADEHCAELVN